MADRLPREGHPNTLDPTIVNWLACVTARAARCLIVVSVVVLARYDLSRVRHAKIQTALIERRASK